MPRHKPAGGEQTGRKIPQGDDEERRYARRWTAFFLFVFIGCLGSALAASWARAAGRAEVEFAFGLLAILLIGQFFFWSILASARRYGYSWIAGLGMVTKHSHPLAYWSMAAIPLLMGAGLTIGVIVAALRRWVL